MEFEIDAANPRRVTGRPPRKSDRPRLLGRHVKHIGEDHAVGIIMVADERVIGTTRNFPGLHHNERVVQKRGAAPGISLQNNSCLMLWERVVSDWMVIDGRIDRETRRSYIEPDELIKMEGANLLSVRAA